MELKNIMKDAIRQLIENNQQWAKQFALDHPGIFDRLSEQQSPDYLWIGCSDSRVPANTVIGLQPGEVFVHRNVANLVNQSDLNLLSVLQYAVQVLGVKHIILCGHYGCGGVHASVDNQNHGIVDNWLHPIKEVYQANSEELKNLDHEQAMDRLCELNVISQVNNLSHTSIVQDAWQSGKDLAIHGFIYGIHDGLIKDLDCTINSTTQVEELFRINS